MITDFKNYLKLNVNSEKTVERYVGVITIFLQQYSVFTQESVNSFLTSLLDKKQSPSTFNVSMCALKQYDTFKETNFHFPKQKNVAKAIKPSLNVTEIEVEILPYFSDLFQDSAKRKLIFRFMMLTMMRISEVENLRKEDINFETKRISILNAKGNKNRVTFLHKSIAEDLKNVLNEHNEESAFNIKRKYVEYMFDQINTMLNYKKHLTPHTLRHAGALHFYETTHDLKALKEILGHESIETTENYIRDYQLDKIQEQYNKVKYKKGKRG